MQNSEFGIRNSDVRTPQDIVILKNLLFVRITYACDRRES